MSNWATDATQTGYDASANLTQAMSARSAQRQASGAISKSKYNVVGIQTSEIPNMQKAINDYVDGIRSYLNTFATNTEASGAVKGAQIETAVKTYVTSVSSYCTSLVEKLLDFNEKLEKVRIAWENSDANIAGRVSSAAGATSTGSAPIGPSTGAGASNL